MYCSKHKRMHTYDQIKRGIHIRFQRKMGLYYHHAIVKEVQKGSNSSCCTLTLIHLQKIGPPILTRVIEETKTYNIREEIVESVTYKSNPFTPDEIIQRAEEYAAQNKTPHLYNLFGSNCDRISHQVAQGVKKSYQVRDILQSGLLWILKALCNIVSGILRRVPGIYPFASIFSFAEIILKIGKLKKVFLDKRTCFGCYDKE